VNYDQLNLKILVVDDEPLVVEELVEFLVSQGYPCVPAHNPPDAINKFRSNPDVVLVLSDFRMKEMNGLQLFEALRAIAGNDRVFETIIFTGDADKADVIEALRAGVSDYFQKPLDLHLLVDGIGRVLAKIERRRAEARIRTLSQSLKVLSTSLNQICEGVEVPAELRPKVVSATEEPQASAALPDEASQIVLDKLSPRQRDVGLLIGRGLTNFQIACELGISENTVKIYVSQILRIFNLRNRTQLALVLEGGRGPGVAQQRRAR
jgi:DNA-binding NarL/FixJ family response regulator